MGLHKDLSPTSHGDKGKSKSEAPSQITVAALSKLDTGMAHELESVNDLKVVEDKITL
jgi:hypothetical protein